MVALAYAPALLLLPILLLVGVFVVVPGGFFIVLSGFYFMLAQIIGVVVLAARAVRRARRKERRARSGIVSEPITYRSSPSRVGALGPTATMTVLHRDQVLARRPSPSRVGTDGLGGEVIVDARRPPRDSGPVA